MITTSPCIPQYLSPSTFAPLPHFDRPTYLMCPPQLYDVDYVINPWMAGNLHRPSRDTAFAQWNNLHQQLQRIADVRLLHARPGSPDMVFVAHSALVQHGVAAVSSFAHPQRQAEEQHLRRWFQDAGFLVWETPRETAFEGEGDALFDANGRPLWAAHGVRTCRQSHRHVADAWHTPVTSLHLVDPRFYHLDTCFAPLSGGHLLYFPAAFDAPSLAKIEAAYIPQKSASPSPRPKPHTSSAASSTQEKTSSWAPTGTDLAARLTELGLRGHRTRPKRVPPRRRLSKVLALRLSDVTVGREI